MKKKWDLKEGIKIPFYRITKPGYSKLFIRQKFENDCENINNR
jgi:hypothetical protein